MTTRTGSQTSRTRRGAPLFLRVLPASVLLVLAFPRPGIGALALVALIPLFQALRYAGVRQAFLAGWCAGAAWFFVSYNWVSHSINVFGGIPMPLAQGAVLLMASIHGAYVGVFAALVPPLLGGDRRRHAYLLLPAAWVVLEAARSWFPAPFPWLLLGTSVGRIGMLLPLYGFAGVYGVSWWIVAVNVLVWSLLTGRGADRALAGSLLAALFLVPVALWPVAVPEGGRTVRVAVVQGNFEQDLKWEEEMREETLLTYLSLTDRAVEEGAELVVWPETAIPVFYQAEPVLEGILRQYASDHGVHLVFGSPGYEIDHREVVLYNRVYHLSPEGGEEFYDKRMLVPFGEYVPMGDLLPFIEKLVPGEGEFARGTWTGPFRTTAPSGALVCYEISFPSLARGEVDSGAAVLINVTNDAWFGRSWGPFQHLAISTIRAMENAVPVLRAANTGISAVIDRRGRVIASIALQERGVTVADVQAGKGPTPYTRFGDWIVIFCLAVIIIYGLIFLILRRSTRWTSSIPSGTHSPGPPRS